MNNSLGVLIGLMEGRRYIIGRDGHIYIDSPKVSKHHAEINITNGKIYLRDLNSTNGTYLVKNRRLVHFMEGYVNPLQPIVIGDQRHTIESLLAIAGVFTDSEDATTQLHFVKEKVNSRI